MSDYIDLLDTPYVEGGIDPATGLNCWGACRSFLISIGMDPPEDPCDFGAWDRVGKTLADATKVGDVILERDPDGQPHTSVLVEPSSGQVLTSRKARGVFVTNKWSCGEVVGVYRLKAGVPC